MFNRLKNPRFVRLFLAGSLALSGAGCGQKSPVLAKVGSQTITAADFDREITRQPFAQQTYLNTLPGRKEMLELLVRRRMLLVESERMAVAEQPDVKKQLEEMDK